MANDIDVQTVRRLSKKAKTGSYTTQDLARRFSVTARAVRASLAKDAKATSALDQADEHAMSRRRFRVARASLPISLGVMVSLVVAAVGVLVADVGAQGSLPGPPPSVVGAPLRPDDFGTSLVGPIRVEVHQDAATIPILRGVADRDLLVYFRVYAPPDNSATTDQLAWRLETPPGVEYAYAWHDFEWNQLPNDPSGTQGRTSLEVDGGVVTLVPFDFGVQTARIDGQATETRVLQYGVTLELPNGYSMGNGPSGLDVELLGVAWRGPSADLGNLLGAESLNLAGDDLRIAAEPQVELVACQSCFVVVGPSMEDQPASPVAHVVGPASQEQVLVFGVRKYPWFALLSEVGLSVVATLFTSIVGWFSWSLRQYSKLRIRT